MKNLFLSIKEAQSKIKMNEKYASFESSVTRGGNPILPEVIVIDNDVFTWSKRKITLITMDIKSIPIKNITQIDVHEHLIGTDFTVYGRGGDKIEAHNFTKSDVNKIRKMINL